MTVRLADDQSEVLEAVALIDGIPMASAVRQAIDEHIPARRMDSGFQERLAASVRRNQRILETLAHM